MERYLALDNLRPGDILLTAEPTWTSAAIRLATFSRVSHAVLVLHPLIWFESVRRGGVGYRVAHATDKVKGAAADHSDRDVKKERQPELVWDKTTVRLGLKIGPGEKYIVKRMKDGLPYQSDDPATIHSFARKLIASTSCFAFWNYSQPDQFLEILRGGLGRFRFVRRLAEKLSRSSSTLYRGPFCSWLVVDCYQALGLKLFDANPDAITPRALDRSKKLEEIECVIRAEPLSIGPRFEAVADRFQRSVAGNRINLETLATLAAQAKSIMEHNAILHPIKQDLQALLKGTTLDKLPDTLAIYNKQLAQSFKDFQQSAQTRVTDAYRELSPQSEAIPLIAPCLRECAREAKAVPCASECIELIVCSNGVRESLKKSFPL